MKAKILPFLLFVGLLISSFQLQAQCTLKGKVTNQQGEALLGAIVQIPGLGIGTTTDVDGMYTLSNVPSGRVSVEAFSLSYEPQTQSVTASTSGVTDVNFTLSEQSIGLNSVVVTGNANPKAALESSISVTTLNARQINNSNVRTTAEIFRSIPGIRSESSGGDGNSNITVRGVPVSAGGSRYLLIQEDGLPVLQFGDVAFGTQDQFLRYDQTVSRIEAVKGGSASVLASNSPAGIINFISKTGENQGGSISKTIGLDFNNYRTDIEYGLPLGNGLSVHFGGFYRAGDGPRKTGFTSNNGGQAKLNIMKRFDGGFVKVYGKFLNDRSAAYMPMPIEVSGTNASPIWKSLSSYDALRGSLQTPRLLHDLTMGGDGNALSSDISDGMHAVSKTVGAEVSVNLGNQWNLRNKTRYSANSGQFLAPFPANVGSATDILSSVGKQAVYAGTTQAVDANGVYMRMHLFNTSLNNFNNFINDVTLSKSFEKVKFNVGLYKSIQNINMDWHWNTYLMEVSDDNARMIDVKDSLGNSLSPNGLLAYGVPAWGNCCNRNFNTHYDIVAPHGNVELNLNDKLNVDLGVRYDLGHVYGSFKGGSGDVASVDMNGNGKIDANENAVATAGNNPTPVNYNYDYLSYSAGANYMLTQNNAVFLRYSSGGSASADRVLFSGYDYTNSDDKSLDAQKVNYVNQVELGYKQKAKSWILNATAFLANTKESNYEATTQKKFDNKYRAAGLELEANSNFANAFNIGLGVTYTNAKIVESKDASVVDNTPRRTPAFMYNLTPSYNKGKLAIGIGLIGATKSYTQDNNKLIMPGYLLVNPYISYKLGKSFNINLQSNNLLNALAVTEAEEGEIKENATNILRGRPLPGRSTSISFSYQF